MNGLPATQLLRRFLMSLAAIVAVSVVFAAKATDARVAGAAAPEFAVAASD